MFDEYFFPFCIAFALLLLPGTLWAMTRQEKFRLSHLLLGMLTYCAVLVPLRDEFLLRKKDQVVFLMLAICLIPLIAGGIVMGAKNERAAPESRPHLRRVIFIAGLLTPVSALPCVISTFGVLALLIDGFQNSSDRWLIVPFWIAVTTPIVVTALHNPIAKFLGEPKQKL